VKYLDNSDLAGDFDNNVFVFGCHFGSYLSTITVRKAGNRFNDAGKRTNSFQKCFSDKRTPDSQEIQDGMTFVSRIYSWGM
jgi:hypothetical protein